MAQGVPSTSTNSTETDSAAPSLLRYEEHACGGDGMIKKKAIHRLSTFSRLCDINGDGELDEAELAMRNMDQSGRGYLTNDKVYDMVRENLETQSRLFRTRRVAFALLALVAILALSSLGTSFAAASLAKDTATSDEDELARKSTGETLGTQTAEETIETHRAVTDTDGGRRLCKGRGNVKCETESFLSLDRRDCDRMVRKCKRGKTVSLVHRWGYGKESHFAVCPSTGMFDDYEKSALRNSHGERFIFERDGEDNCILSGDAVSQDEGEICLVTEDCREGLGLVCVKERADVDLCRRRCGMKRWARRKAEECQENCDHPICKVETATRTQQKEVRFG